MTARGSPRDPLRVVDAGGAVGEVGASDDGALLRVRRADGPWLLVPIESFEPERDGVLRMRHAFADLEAAAAGEVVVRAVEERARVERRRVRSGGVRVRVRVEQTVEHVEGETEEERLEVVHVPDGRVVAAPLADWTEGDVLCVPVHEEVLVVERRLRVREVIRIARTRTRAPRRLDVALRREEVELSPLSGEGDDERR